MPWGTGWRFGDLNPWDVPGIPQLGRQGYWEREANIPGYIKRMIQVRAGTAPSGVQDWLSRRLWTAKNLWEAQGAGERAGNVPYASIRPLGDLLQSYVTGENAPWSPGGDLYRNYNTPREFAAEMLKAVTSGPLRSQPQAQTYLTAINRPDEETARNAVDIVGEAAGLPDWMRRELDRNAADLRATYTANPGGGPAGDTFLDWLMRKFRLEQV